MKFSTKHHRHLYKKMFKRNKKTLTKIHKEAAKNPWEYGHGTEYLVAFMKFMYEYYTLGENVWQSDESLQEVKDTLKEALDAYHDWQSFDYFAQEGDVEKYNNEYNRRRERFFKLLSDNIEKWWD